MNNKYNTIEDVIKYINNKHIDGIQRIQKYDGISVEITLNDASVFDTVKSNINTLCKKINLLPTQFEQQKINNNVFILQLPQLDVKYTEEQINRAYISAFNYLLEDTLKQLHSITKQELLHHKTIYVRNAIIIFCRNNINPYRTPSKQFLTNPDYVFKITNLFIQYINNLSNIH